MVRNLPRRLSPSSIEPGNGGDTGNACFADYACSSLGLAPRRKKVREARLSPVGGRAQPGYAGGFVDLTEGRLGNMRGASPRSHYRSCENAERIAELGRGSKPRYRLTRILKPSLDQSAGARAARAKEASNAVAPRAPVTASIAVKQVHCRKYDCG
jgi:hypothetical protein